MKFILLRTLQMQDHSEFLRALERFPKEGDFNFVFSEVGRDIDSFREFIEKLEQHRMGIRLPVGHLSNSLLFAFNDKQEIVGRVSIRHHLNDYLLEVGGHIGYGVVPQFRRQGYASEMLRLSLQVLSQGFEAGKSSIDLQCGKFGFYSDY